ncbi:SUMF1/EgtB/PvdO family nonheme iron enzyme [Lysobacter niabensis]|uniref:SUMF1/EgtB/PvdO family nonheme iron enzyme n=1 Tax=Agrilutibacter niabensis TaxID=380628 RepID=UPI00360F1CC7
MLGCVVACGRKQAGKDEAAARAPVVTIGEDQSVSPVPPWRAPAIEVTDANADALRKRAEAALKAKRLYGGANESETAIPLFLALQKHAPQDDRIRRGLRESLLALADEGRAALAAIDHEPQELRHAHEAAAVARVVAPGDPRVEAFLDRLDRADEASRANLVGEMALNAGRIGEKGEVDGAIAYFREALRARPEDSRARQGLAAAESALIRRAEAAAAEDDYDSAAYWLEVSGSVRPGFETVADARERIAMQRVTRVNGLRDIGIAELATPTAAGLRRARERLAQLLRIAAAGDPSVLELRTRIEMAAHYGLFRPGQAFTDALSNGGRGPQMVVVPHGAFRMGAPETEADSSEAERPVRNVRFDRGIAMSRTEITVGEFRRFVNATRHRPRATRRGYSTIYDERSGNFVRAGNVDWQSDYVGRPAADDMPVLHVSVGDALRYAEWLSGQTGHRYRLPSEAEFEYVLRAGSQERFPWGDASPPVESGNFTGANDVSPSGRRWTNAFVGYGDNAWGPAPVGSYQPNRWGVHDLAGNVSEWVEDCWHSTFRRAPRDGRSWVNPGCRNQVIRGGSWANSPAHSRSAWRQGTDINNTSARVGFRVVREI